MINYIRVENKTRAKVTNKVLNKYRGIFAHPQWLTAQDHAIMKRGVKA